MIGYEMCVVTYIYISICNCEFSNHHYLNTNYKILIIGTGGRSSICNREIE